MKKLLLSLSMKHLILLINLLVGFTVHSATYYVSTSTGNDSYTATQAQNPATPWKTPAKLNSMLFKDGDIILFKRGDTFRGQINVTNGLTFGAYGTGNAPIISGAIPIKGWTVWKGNIYQAPLSSTVKKLIVNGKTMTRARFPNKGFLTFGKGISKTSFSDPNINKPSGYWNGAHVRLSIKHWNNHMAFVTEHKGTTINYHPASSIIPLDGYTYYFDNKLEELDVENEWFYDSKAQKIYFYAPGGVDPNTLTVEGAIHNFGFKGGRNCKYVTIKDLQIEKQLVDGVYLYNGAGGHNTIINNKFSMQMECGIEFMGDNTRVEGNSFTDIDGRAVVGNASKNSIITNNTFKRIGMRIGYGMSTTTGYRLTGGIILGGATSNFKIAYNTLDSLGYLGIRPDGSYHTVERNIIKYSCINHSDGAAIYAWGDITHHLLIRDNYIVNPRGLAYGAPGHLAYGIYLDVQAHHCTITHNTIRDSDYGGILLNAGCHNNVVTKNVCFNNKISNIKLDDWKPSAPVYSNVVSNNVLYSTIPTSFSLHLNSKFERFNMGRYDSNYYCNPYGDISVKRSNYARFPAYSVDQWKTVSAQDKNTKKSLYKWQNCEAVKITGSNIIPNGTFSSNMNGWSYWNKSYSKAEYLTSGMDGGCVKYTINSNGAPNGYLISPTFAGQKDKSYALKFSIKSTKNGVVTAVIRQAHSPYTPVHTASFPLNTVRTNYHHVFTLPITDSNLRLDIEILYEASNFTIDNVSITPVDVTCHKPLDRSKIFANPSDNTIKVDLAGKTYKDLNGNTVTGSISIEPWGSKVLLLAPATANSLAGGGRLEEEGTEISSLNLYPNPGRSAITVSSEKGEITSAKIVNALGTKILSKTNINKEEFNLDVSNWPMGVYLIEVKYANQEQELKRLIVED